MTSLPPLNLCFVADATSIHVKRWLGALVKRGHQVTCLADKGGDIDGVTVLELPNRDTLLGWGKKTNKTTVIKERSRAIQRAVAQLKPDVVHAIFLYQRGWSAALANCHPLVITLLGSDIFLQEAHYRHKLHYLRDVALNQGALQQADLVTAVNQNLAQEAQALCRESLNMLITPIGTDGSVFNQTCDPQALHSLRQSLQITDGAFVILSPRQITPLYNIDVILEALPAILAQQPNTVLILKNTACTTDERQTYVDQLKTQAQQLGIDHAIRWVGEVPYETLSQYFHLANLVVSIPKTDGLPVTLFDAMACGVPCIVGDLPSYDGVITHQQTGWRISLNNANALADAIVTLAASPDLRQQLVSQSQTVLNDIGLFDGTIDTIEAAYYALAQLPHQVSSQLNQLLYKMLIRVG